MWVASVFSKKKLLIWSGSDTPTHSSKANEGELTVESWEFFYLFLSFLRETVKSLSSCPRSQLWYPHGERSLLWIESEAWKSSCLWPGPKVAMAHLLKYNTAFIWDFREVPSSPDMAGGLWRSLFLLLSWVLSRSPNIEYTTIFPLLYCVNTLHIRESNLPKCQSWK